MRRLFLFKVYRYNKILFWFFALFAGLSVIGNLMGNEATPFYVWGMYSEKEAEPSDYEIFRITVNNKPVDYSTGFLPANRFFLQSPLIYYSLMKNGVDPTSTFLENKLKEKYRLIKPWASEVFNSEKEVAEFPAWYKKYLAQSTGQNVQSFKVEVLKATFSSNNAITIHSTYTLIDER